MLEQAISTLTVCTPGRGLLEISDEVRSQLAASGIRDGVLTLFVRHTSASLLIQENADLHVRADLDRFFARLVPDGDPLSTCGNTACVAMHARWSCMCSVSGRWIPWASPG